MKGAEEELPGQEVVRAESPSTLVTAVVGIEPTGRTGREKVPVNQKGLQLDTCIAGEGHVGTPGYPTGHLGVEASTLAGVGGLLRTYEGPSRTGGSVTLLG